MTHFGEGANDLPVFASGREQGSGGIGALRPTLKIHIRRFLQSAGRKNKQQGSERCESVLATIRLEIQFQAIEQPLKTVREFHSNSIREKRTFSV